MVYKSARVNTRIKPFVYRKSHKKQTASLEEKTIILLVIGIVALIGFIYALGFLL